ncbi:uncharacterized protein BXZ73DRAFT_96680 [Epithele typhae]|uniref:uncharacterized protein n=1 Tax=Epithele typhae TaxID=378194 RepID=UPI0020075F8F|nr:uncharacterized protein BXZ73DRAFT_96680 [Epithele typhae]KAH9944187.1 hypothetical protein BXZ73DRAFT_96680 [Epithele typhae]
MPRELPIALLPAFPRSYHPSLSLLLRSFFPFMLCVSPPPILRRISSRKSSPTHSVSSKRSFSDFALVKRAYLSRGDSKQSERTLVETSEPQELKIPFQVDVLLIEAPTPPPKDRFEVTAYPERHPLERHQKPLPIPRLELTLEDTEPIFPWYRRRFIYPDTGSRYTPSQPSVFPRSDFAFAAPASGKTGLNLFGGLVNDRAKNDVYSISAQDQGVTRLYTIGDIPSPRFGQKSAFAGSVLVISRVDAHHCRRAVTHRSNWALACDDRPEDYIFGGEANGALFNDLWCFDLSSLVSKPYWEYIHFPSPKGNSGQMPSPRSGHTCIAHKGQLIMFGGTDGQYHYNDTWVFDPASRSWTELSCFGYIPTPRESHAAAIVDDIMYVYGGRGVDGANMGSLAAFKISTRRWFMFQNMGPEPSPRSGHGMAAVGSKVYVLGGVSEEDMSGSGKDANFMYILDTKNIKFPTTKHSAPRHKALLS